MRTVYIPITTTFLVTHISRRAATHKSTKFVMTKHKHRRRKSKFTTHFLMLSNGIYSNIFISFTDDKNWWTHEPVTSSFYCHCSPSISCCSLKMKAGVPSESLLYLHQNK